MNLGQALAIVSTPLNLPGRSDDGLAAEVNARASIDGGGMVASAELDGGRVIRAVDMLLRLTQATRPHYKADVYDLHAHWALLRYLGVFDYGMAWAGPSFGLSDAGRRIVGNQRRVFSEEVGIGFAVLLAENWMAGKASSSTVPRTVDIDVALAEGFVDAGGAIKSVRATGVRRPDYLLVCDDARVAGRFRLSVLECKGTKSATHSLNQLASASEQLRGVRVAGNVPAGLAVSTVLSNSAVRYNALQTAESARLGSRYMDESVAPTGQQNLDREGEPVEVDIDLDRLTVRSEVNLDRSDDVTPEDLASAALTASWASLGDFGGNDDAFSRWAPTTLRTKLDRDQDARRERVSREINGISLRGMRNVVALPGGRLEVFLGVESSVDEALTSGDAERVLVEQGRLTEFLRQTEAPQSAAGDVVAAVAEDGAALLLTPL